MATYGKSRKQPRKSVLGGGYPRVRGVGTAMNPVGEAKKEEAEKKESPTTLEALEAARNGDDSLLLPYQPTPSINPPRPRTLAAGYDSQTKTLRVRFREGAMYGYYGVPPRVWQNFKRSKSPGRFINRVLNNYPYAREDL